MSADQRSKAAA